MTDYDKIKSILPLVSHHIQVSFALFCAKDALQYVKDKQAVNHCIELLESWLVNPKSVSKNELTTAANAAAYAAYAAANAAAHAANAAAYAANAANAAKYDKKMKYYLSYFDKPLFRLVI